MYDVCNFGRGHCEFTVMSSYGWRNGVLYGGGCGDYGPIIGTSGVIFGVARIYVA